MALFTAKVTARADGQDILHQMTVFLILILSCQMPKRRTNRHKSGTALCGRVCCMLRRRARTRSQRAEYRN